MTTQLKNIYYGIGFVILAFILIFGVRSYRISSINSLIKDGQLTTGILSESISWEGEDYLIPPTDIFETNTDMPAINEPVFTSVASADSYLADDVKGIDVEVNGAHRFYSYQILNWHEVVNDNFGGIELAVTHCDLCISSEVYKTDLDFESAGLVYNNNQLLKDIQTNSLWSQIRGIAVSGDSIGETLEQYPYQIMTWSDWKEKYPNGEVLSTDTGFERDYGSHPYAANYDSAKIVYFPINNHSYQLSDKAPIKGFIINGKPFAVSDIIMSVFWAWNGEVGGQGVSVFYNIDDKTTRIYSTDINDSRLTFEFDIENNTFIDDQTGSTWNIDGLAIDGELSGTQLTEFTDYQTMFLMCFVGVYGDAIETTKDNSTGGSILGSNDNVTEGESIEIEVDQNQKQNESEN